MRYYLPSSNPDSPFQRKDYEPITDKFEPSTETEVIYLGDFFLRSSAPEDFLGYVCEKVDENCVLYIEQPDILELAASIVYGAVSVKDLSDMIFNNNYVRLLDINECRKIILSAGFSLLAEDIDKNKFSISFYKKQ